MPRSMKLFTSESVTEAPQNFHSCSSLTGQGHPDKMAESLLHRKVLAVYGFGSFFRGTAQRHSDVDLGVLFVRRPTLRAIGRVRDALTDVFGRDRIDLAVLNTAAPLISYEAVVRGRNLYSAPQFQRALYETQVLKEYEDTRHLRLAAGAQMIRRIKTGTFGKVQSSLRRRV